jgi:hypothetical protein
MITKKDSEKQVHLTIQPMAQAEIPFNEELTQFLNDLNHPLRKEIDQLRQIVLSTNAGLSENIKWNGPNFCSQGEDRITMRIHPTTQLQLIFHRGAKVLAQPVERLIQDRSNLLNWKTNDRAVVTYKSLEEILSSHSALSNIVKAWVAAAQ